MATADRKLPRVDLRKYLAGGVAGRREVVALIGDALRESGGVRIEGHDVAVDDHAAVAVVADHLLEALAEYFGLEAGTFLGAAGATASTAGAVAIADVLRGALLVVLPAVPAGAEVRSLEGAWTPVAARPGELLAVPGGALCLLTGNVVPAAALRWRDAEGVRAVVVAPRAAAELRPLAEFGGTRHL
ncbi:MAG TPA: hypothetical protein VGV61_12270 [Thermoanaerobaculia bacterium]|nr:hypothetical protein [Thermoanaerobaculia bacterium]